MSIDHGGDEIFRKLVDTAPDATIVVDENGVIVLVNLQTERVFGYARNELVGQKVEVLIPERYRVSHVTHRLKFSKDSKVRPMGSGLELFGVKRDGTEFPIEISLSPVVTERGTLVSASIRDITDRKQNEVRLKHTQAHLLSAVESIQGAFAIFDGQDRLVLCNSDFRQRLGRDLTGEIAGRTFEEIVDANLQSDSFDLGDEDVARFRSRWVEYHRKPDGALDVRTRNGRNLRLVERQTTESGTVSTIWDVTDEVEHEAELKRARADAEAASSAKSEFLSSMSHELRTPLNAILGFAQLLQRDKKTPLADRHRERIDHVLKGGEHLLRLIDDILDLSRIEAGRVSLSPEVVAVDSVLGEVKTTLDPMAARSELTLVLDAAAISTALPEVIADRTRFKQVLMNYGSNAIKYGRKGGTVRFTAKEQGARLRVSVTDDGFGIPADKQDKIFQPFQRAGQETGPIEGTGIGLAITKRLAELMAGTVGFSSVEGKGSEFWIELAIHRAGADAAERSPSSDIPQISGLAGAEGPHYRIVYIEDNPSNIAFMEDLLSDFERVELVSAPTAEIGIELVRAQPPDVVIMDINLPGISGFEATRRLQGWPETKNVPVIALSAAAMVRDAQRVKDAGFYRYLTKPVKVAELSEVLEQLLSGERPATSKE